MRAKRCRSMTWWWRRVGRSSSRRRRWMWPGGRGSIPVWGGRREGGCEEGGGRGRIDLHGAAGGARVAAGGGKGAGGDAGDRPCGAADGKLINVAYSLSPVLWGGFVKFLGFLFLCKTVWENRGE